MKLLEFKDYVLSLDELEILDYGISEPFSWRGSYDEVAFSILNQPTPIDEILRNINLAYTNIFIGWKGGEYRYNDFTTVNFESGHGEYSDGEYCAKWISVIENSEQILSQEERLIKLMFPK